MTGQSQTMFPSLIFAGWLAAFAWIVIRFV